MTDKPGVPGRRSLLLDGRRIRNLLELVKLGTPRYQAGIVVGVGSSTMMAWLRDGATAQRKLEEGLELTEPERRFLKFRERLLRAEAFFEARTIGAALAIAEQTEKPAVMLEILRRHPATRERWNVPTRVEVAPLVSDEVPEIPDAELAATIARLHRISLERKSDNPSTPASTDPDSMRGRSRRRRSSVKSSEGDRS